MKRIKLVFQGDSITDAGRDKRDFHDLGNGYPKYAAELIKNANSDIEFDFINLGISGNRTDQLFDRLYPDAIALEPDVISILIGINDIWHRFPPNSIPTTYEQIELNYREILKNIKARTNAKIVMLSPYVIHVDNIQHLDEVEEYNKILVPIIESLAQEYADAYIPLDKLFKEAIANHPEPKYYSNDGIHPNETGAKFISEHYANAVNKLFS